MGLLPGGVRAVVTGAGSGLGRALALEVARRGGRVLVSDIDMDGAEETVRRVQQAGGTAYAMPCDVREPDHLEALADEAERVMGGTDLLANNAGVAVGGGFSEIPIEDWQWAFDINLWGVIHGCRAFGPRFVEQGRGLILNVASLAGLVCAPHMSPYNVTKAGVVALSETLHAELAEHGVHVTVLCPSFFATGILDSARGGDDRMRAVARYSMDSSKVQAPDVARAALDAVDRGRLYAVPMMDARLAWGIKRVAPDRLPWVMRSLLKWAADYLARRG